MDDVWPYDVVCSWSLPSVSLVQSIPPSHTCYLAPGLVGCAFSKATSHLQLSSLIWNRQFDKNRLLTTSEWRAVVRLMVTTFQTLSDLSHSPSCPCPGMLRCTWSVLNCSNQCTNQLWHSLEFVKRSCHIVQHLRTSTESTPAMAARALFIARAAPLKWLSWEWLTLAGILPPWQHMQLPYKRYSAKPALCPRRPAGEAAYVLLQLLHTVGHITNTQQNVDNVTSGKWQTPKPPQLFATVTLFFLLCPWFRTKKLHIRHWQWSFNAARSAMRSSCLWSLHLGDSAGLWEARVEIIRLGAVLGTWPILLTDSHGATGWPTGTVYVETMLFGNTLQHSLL